MLKVLVKKQLSEVFRSYFYDAKKNKMRSKWAIAAWFVFFIVIMAGMLGGMFTALSLTLCDSLSSAGMGWLYFLLLSGIAIVMGAFGSVFNTYSSLYLGKDNDLLLSLPIPVNTIIAARLINVYLLGAMYSATALLPALAVDWIVNGLSAARVICGIGLFLIVTVIVLLLSCVLGWVVAKNSVKLKNKSFLTVLIALLFIGAYYFFYFKANDLIRDIILNAGIYGERIKGAAWALYQFGRIGEGSWAALGVCAAAAALLFALVWTALSRSFIKIATAGGKTGKIKYTEKTVRQKTAFGALLQKEFSRFTSSPNYMLNCGLGVLLIPACGVLLLIKGREICDAINMLLSARPGSTEVVLCTMLCALSSMNDMAAPSVSLEGKSLWILQSLPVAPKTVLHAKASVQLILAGRPMLFASVCAVAVCNASLPVRLPLVSTPLLCVAFSALFGTAIGVKMPILHWTSELAPIKQGGAVAISLFGGWAVCLVLAGLYLVIGYKIGAALYLLIWSLLFAAASLLILRWINTKGSAAFGAL